MGKRPAFLMAIAFSAGIIAAFFIRQIFFFMLIFLVIILFYIICLLKKLPWKTHILVFGVLLFCGYIDYAFQYTLLTSPFHDIYDEKVTMSGYILSPCHENDGKASFNYFVETIKTQHSEYNINRAVKVNLYNLDSNNKLTVGKYIDIKGQLRKAQASRNPGGFSYQNYLLSSKVAAYISIGSESIIIKDCEKKLPLLSLGENLQKSILSSLNKNLSYEKSALMAAMLTGYRENLTEPMENAFSASGLVHIMAVSGANIAFLLLPVLWLFRMLGFNRKAGAAFAIPLIFFYTLITGMEASVLRASIMALIILFGRIFDRKAEIINSLCIASLVILIINPFMLMDVGFQLSAGATAGLGLLYKKIHEVMPGKIPEIIKGTASATLAAQAGVLPILVLCFSRVSVVSLLSNLFVVPLTGITTVMGMISVILDNISHKLGELTGYVLQALLHLILLVTNAFASVPWAELNMKHWNILLVLLYYTLLVITGCSSAGFFTRHKSKAAACLFLMGAILLVQSFIPGKLKVTFIDVGQGDSALIKTPGGATMLIDGGGSYNELDTLYIGQSVIFPVLMQERIGKLDYVIVTHADADHMYGILTLMDIFPVKKAVLPDYNEAIKDFSRLIELCREMGTEIVFLSESDKINLDEDTEIEILYPVKGASGYSNLNNVSLCGMLKYKQFQVLFTGDMEKEAENILLKNSPDLDCDVLKVSHHGGKNGTSGMFLNASCPEAAVISVGINNYGHPSKDVLDRLYEADTKVYKTLECGAVIVESDGLRYRIKTWLKDERFTFLY